MAKPIQSDGPAIASAVPPYRLATKLAALILLVGLVPTLHFAVVSFLRTGRVLWFGPNSFFSTSNPTGHGWHPGTLITPIGGNITDQAMFVGVCSAVSLLVYAWMLGDRPPIRYSWGAAALAFVCGYAVAVPIHYVVWEFLGYGAHSGGNAKWLDFYRPLHFLAVEIRGLLLPQRGLTLQQWSYAWRTGVVPYYLIPSLLAAGTMVCWTRCLSRRCSCWALCARCGYDLRGSPNGTCPECGTPTGR